MSILCYVALSQGTPTRSSLEVLSHCRVMADGNVSAVVLSDGGFEGTDAIATHGARTIYRFNHPLFAQHLNPPVIEALAGLIEEVKPSVVAFPSTEGVKDVLGALAARLEAPAVPDVSSFELRDGGIEARRPVMAAKFQSVVRAEGSPVLVSVRAGSYQVSEAPVDTEVVDRDFAYDESSLRQTIREVRGGGGGRVDLTEARVVIAAGRGVRDERAQKLVEDLAETTGAAVGATRAVVESGMYPATAQIGQTGKVVSPDVYFGVGVSGAVQHTAGITNSRVIVAVNKDPDAPIFDIATFGLVGDLYEILPALVEEIRK